MADEYDPNDCELGICGPCDACIEQMKIDSTPEGFTGEEADVSKPEETQELAAQYKNREPIGTIDLTPSWVTVVGIYLELLDSEGADHYKKADAKKEIMRAAALADLYVKEHKR